MFGWFYLGIERLVRAGASRQARASQHSPLWLIRKVSQAKLVWTLRYVYRNSPAQRQRWNQAGVKLSDIRSAEVLRRIPFTTGPELAQNPEEYICVANEELIHILTTSSTTGVQKKIYLTSEDFNHQSRAIGAMMGRFPGAKRVAVMFLVQDPTWTAGTIIRSAIAEARMLGFLSGIHRSIPQQIELIKEYGIDYLITAPSYLSRLTFETSEEVSKLGVRYIQLGSQPWTEEFRRQMEQAWGAKLIDGYGSSECACGIAAECLHQNGLHVGEVDYWIEIIDPLTLEVLPDGEEGEAVITTLSRRGMPLVRYRTGDISYLLPRGQRCQCGFPLRKMGRIRGRVDDMLIVGSGHNLYPDELDRAVLSIPGVSDYQLVLDKDGYKDVIHLTVEVARPLKDLRGLLENILLGVRSIGLSHDVTGTLSFGRMEAVAPGSLSRGRPKTVRIVDQRVAASR